MEIDKRISYGWQERIRQQLALPAGGGAIYHEDHTVEPLRHALVELSLKEGAFISEFSVDLVLNSVIWGCRHFTVYTTFLFCYPGACAPGFMLSPAPQAQNLTESLGPYGDLYRESLEIL